jgi:hypothetical protein
MAVETASPTVAATGRMPGGIEAYSKGCQASAWSTPAIEDIARNALSKLYSIQFMRVYPAIFLAQP